MFFLFFVVDSYGQSISNYEFGSGLHFESSDQNYQFNLGGLLLPHISVESFDDEQSSNMFYGSKRTFFHFKANSNKENVSAYFLTDFSSNNPLLEAWVSYQPFNKLTITFGQSKGIANNREMLISENELAYFNRTLLSETYNQTGREFGLTSSYMFGNNDFALVPSIQITSGDGLNSFGEDSRDVDLGGLKYASRLDLYPLGLFQEGQIKSMNDGAYEEQLKIVLGLAASYNDGASEAVGEGHGEFYLYNILGNVMLPDYRELNFDFLSRYKSFSFMAEYSISTATKLEGLITESLIQSLQPTEISTYLALGSGFSSQLYYTFSSGFSIGLIYSSVEPEFQNQNSIVQEMNKKSLVLSKKVTETALMMQTSFDVVQIDGENTFQSQWSIQLEF